MRYYKKIRTTYLMRFWNQKRNNFVSPNLDPNLKRCLKRWKKNIEKWKNQFNKNKKRKNLSILKI